MEGALRNDINSIVSVWSLYEETMLHRENKAGISGNEWFSSYRARVALPSEEYQILLYSQECRLKRELDTKSFSTRLEASLAQFRHFTCPRFRSENEEFTIHHFADSVSYQVEGLVKKNKVRT